MLINFSEILGTLCTLDTLKGHVSKLLPLVLKADQKLPQRRRSQQCQKSIPCYIKLHQITVSYSLVSDGVHPAMNS